MSAAACQCPTCGAPVAQGPLDPLKAVVPPTMARIIDIVARRPGVSLNDLADAIYAGTINGGPGDGASSVKVMICKGNKRLAPLGWRVRSPVGAGNSAYRLEAIQ